MLVALATAFALSQAFRTVGAMMATPLGNHFGLTPQQLGTWAGTFHFMFGIMQLAMGVSIDIFGVRRTVLTAFPLAIAGAVLCAMAPDFHALLLGQALIGVAARRPSWPARCSSRGTSMPRASPRCRGW